MASFTLITKFRRLKDVFFGTPNDGDVVTYDAGTDKLVLAAPSGGGGGAPSGPAGGVLSGTYPDPGFAVDMATQAELDAAVALLVPLTRLITAGAGLAGGGDLSADRTLSVNVDATTIEITADTLQVKDGGITVAKLSFDPATQAELDALAAAAVLDGDAAGGVLAGTYPSPSFAVDMATQAELDAAISALAGTVSIDVAQNGHGFAVGDLVRVTGANTYAKALANSAANAEVAGIVTAVADANNFSLVVSGQVSGLSGLVAGTVYFLDPSTAGALTATEPTSIGQVSKPVLIATDTGTGLFFNMRGALVAAGGSSAGSSDDHLKNALGIVTWTHPPDLCNTCIQKNSGFLHGHAVWVNAGEVITSIYVFVGTVSSGQTHAVAAVLDESYTVLAKSADTPSWTGTQGWRKVDLSSPWTCPADGLYYLGITFTAATMPNLLANSLGAGSSTGRGQIGASNPRWWWFDSSAAWTDFPAVGDVVPVPQVSSNDQCIVAV